MTNFLPLRTAALTLTTVLAAAAGAVPVRVPAPGPARVVDSPDQPWPVRTREHLDLWLHAFALLQDDSGAMVPLFRRGYRDRMVVLRNQRRVSTQLDRDRDSLHAGFAANRLLTGAQFIPLYFDSWEQLRRGADLFLQADGNPQRARSQDEATAIALFASSFPAARDRAWLRLFVRDVDDERTRFYHDWWVTQQRERAPVLAAVDSVWQRVDRPRLQRFLTNTQQSNGELLLSLPLGGEGRTVKGSSRQNEIAVTFPERPADAEEAVYVLVHEAVGQVAGEAIADNTTPVEKRTGVADRLTSAGAVRGGLLLLDRVAPAMGEGYARYYLRAAGRPEAGDARAALAAAFPLPDAIRTALERQLDIVLGGI